jgi:hypothetical protein
MTIFAILLPTAQPAIAERITTAFQTDALRISDTQWLVSASGTAAEIAARLGIVDLANPQAPTLGTGIVFSTSGYFGRAPTNIWEWIKAKLESPPTPSPPPPPPASAPTTSG